MASDGTVEHQAVEGVGYSSGLHSSYWDNMSLTALKHRLGVTLAN